jgi:nucleoside-diphosphate-sugar epimerase
MPGSALITGAYGYLGSVIRSRLESAGWQTTALVRSPRPGDRAARWRLDSNPGAAPFDGASALVHCAYDLVARTPDDVWRINVAGTAQLLDAAKTHGVDRLLVLSSMSAYPGTRQLYGRAKLAIEESTLAHGGIAIRPGLTYGDDPSGMAGALVKITRLPVVPVIGRRALQFPVHQDDLADAIETVLEASDWVPEVFGVAQPDPVSFRDLLEALARQRGRTCRFVPVPWQLVYWALRLAELSPVQPPLRSDSVLGLVRPAPRVQPSRAFPEMLSQLRTLTATESPMEVR